MYMQLCDVIFCLYTASFGPYPPMPPTLATPPRHPQNFPALPKLPSEFIYCMRSLFVLKAEISNLVTCQVFPTINRWKLLCEIIYDIRYFLHPPPPPNLPLFIEVHMIKSYIFTTSQLLISGVPLPTLRWTLRLERSSKFPRVFPV